MPFDPTQPVPHTLGDADVMREQLNSLKALIDAVPAGPPGKDGKNGADGKDGKDGVGIQGPPGKDGKDGGIGPQGNPGTDGAPGPTINYRGDWQPASWQKDDGVNYNGSVYLALHDVMSSTPPDADTANWQAIAMRGPQGDPGAGFPYAGDAEIDGSVFVQGELALFNNDPNTSDEAGVRIGKTNPGNGYLPTLSSRRSGMSIWTHALDLGGITYNMGMPSVQDGDLLQYRASDQTWHPVTGVTADMAVGGVTLRFVNGVFLGQV